MRKRMERLIFWSAVCTAYLMHMQGCIFDDPDVRLRTGLSLASDLSIFLLQNAATGL